MQIVANLCLASSKKWIKPSENHHLLFPQYGFIAY